MLGPPPEPVLCQDFLFLKSLKGCFEIEVLGIFQEIESWGSEMIDTVENEFEFDPEVRATELTELKKGHVGWGWWSKSPTVIASDEVQLLRTASAQWVAVWTTFSLMGPSSPTPCAAMDALVAKITSSLERSGCVPSTSTPTSNIEET